MAVGCSLLEFSGFWVLSGWGKSWAQLSSSCVLFFIKLQVTLVWNKLVQPKFGAVAQSLPCVRAFGGVCSIVNLSLWRGRRPTILRSSYQDGQTSLTPCEAQGGDARVGGRFTSLPMVIPAGSHPCSNTAALVSKWHSGTFISNSKNIVPLALHFSSPLFHESQALLMYRDL